MPGQQTKQPVYITRRDRAFVAVAGLYADAVPDGAGGTCALITTAPNELVAHVHDRMPVLLHPDDAALWLDASVPAEDAVRCLRPCPAHELEAYTVGTGVSWARSEGPALIAPLESIPTGGTAWQEALPASVGTAS